MEESQSSGDAKRKFAAIVLVSDNERWVETSFPTSHDSISWVCQSPKRYRRAVGRSNLDLRSDCA